MKAPIPILILGDNPALPGGLSRIGHDLAQLLSSMPEFEVGYMGRGGKTTRRFPWMQYPYHESEQWGETLLQTVWEDFAGKRQGILFSVWDASRLLWLVDPTGMPNERWLRNPPFKKWGYFMQDAEGVTPAHLPMVDAGTMQGFDRVLLASEWAYQLTNLTLRHKDVDWLPHGINTKVFAPTKMSRDEILAARKSLWGPRAGTQDVPVEVWGCVMANQARKHWPTVFETLRLSPEAFLWAHSNAVMGYWNLLALAIEYEVQDRVFIDTLPRMDDEMAFFYNLCNLTLLISGGEGFGYPIAESLACGVPVATGRYGAGGDLVKLINDDNVLQDFGIWPSHYTIDTQYNVRRAHYDALSVDLSQMTDPRSLVEHLDWSNIGPLWKRWFLKGLGQ